MLMPCCRSGINDSPGNGENMDTWNWLLTPPSAVPDMSMAFCVEQLRRAVPESEVPERLVELASSSTALLAFYHKEFAAHPDHDNLDIDKLVATINAKWVEEVSTPRLLITFFVGSNLQQPPAFA